jgi:hypothetical protein
VRVVKIFVLGDHNPIVEQTEGIDLFVRGAIPFGQVLGCQRIVPETFDHLAQRWWQVSVENKLHATAR